MKIAVTYENGQIFQHFGRTEQFAVYTIENGKLIHSEIIPTDGQGHGALAGFLEANEIDALICGGIGGGAQAALSSLGIRLYGGVTGDAENAARALAAGTLRYETDIRCEHHAHEGSAHSCGDHGCGQHSCHN